MAEKAHILIVDDDPAMRELARGALGADTYRYSIAADGLDALARIATDKPDVLLLDVLMPVMDGLEACRRIRADPLNGDIHIVFITSLDNDENRQAAYEAGGDDMLLKPLHATELRRKVDAALEHRRLVTDLRRQVAEIGGVLMSSMLTSGKYGVVMNALRQSLDCRTPGDLAAAALKALEEFGLRGSIQLRQAHSIFTLNTEGRSSPLEQEMLLKLSLENRHIYDYGSRTVFCWQNVAILVKDMPLDDPDVYGRTKDIVAVLAEACDFRLKAMEEETLVRRQRETLAGSAALASQVLGQVDTLYKRGQSEIGEIFGELERGLEQAFTRLGLTEDQERGLLGIVRPLMARATALYEAGFKLDEQLAGALESLRLSLEEAGKFGGDEVFF